jgi:colanic acid biosynthesis glycosyl transferase WcaI
MVEDIKASVAGETLLPHTSAGGSMEESTGHTAAPEQLRILVYGLNFAPEPTGIGKYTGEMAHWLAAAGHEVRVITALPYYPRWEIAPGYRAWRYIREDGGGLRVLRAPLWVPRSPGGARRVLHLMSFAASSFVPVLWQALSWRPQVLLCIAPALACAPGALLAARMCGALAWLHLQDFEVDAAFELGMLRGAAVRRAALASERVLLRGFDRVSTISRRMADRLAQKGVDPQSVRLFPNWVDTEAIRPMPADNCIRRELDIPPSAFVALYSGTMGAKQGLEVMAGAAERLAGETNVHFIFCGEGAGRAGLQGACEGLARIHWLPLQPAQRLPELLAAADAHLLPQLGAAADLVLPSKLGGMLASGRPVLATAEAGTELAGWVTDCGFVTPPGDAEALAEALQRLNRSPQLCRDLGSAARRRARERLVRDDILRDFIAEARDALQAPPVRVAPVRDLR